MKIGFIGLGMMGRGMAANLQKAGYALVVNDLTRQAASHHLEGLGITFKVRQDTNLSTYDYSSKGAVTIGLKAGGRVPLSRARKAASLTRTCAVGCASRRSRRLEAC